MFLTILKLVQDGQLIFVQTVKIIVRHHAGSLIYHPMCILFLDVLTHAFTYFRCVFGFTFNFNSA